MGPTWICAVGCLLAFAAIVHSDEAADDAKMLNGTWVVSSADLSGKAMPDDFVKSLKLTIDGEKYTVKVGDEVEKGTAKIDPTKKPKTMDISPTEGPNKGKKILAIYQIDGDALKVCYRLGEGDRPEEFKSTAENKLFLVNYKREKP
jgi:uncharacterized protein (TIGR03067 family)